MKAETISMFAGLAGLALSMAATAQTSPEASSCLEAVRSGDYRSALVVCAKALEMDPGNEELQRALQTAKAATGDGGREAPMSH